MKKRSVEEGKRLFYEKEGDRGTGTTNGQWYLSLEEEKKGAVGQWRKRRMPQARVDQGQRVRVTGEKWS